MTAAKKKTVKRRLLVWGGTAVILLLIGLSLVPKPQPADFATVERGPLSVTIDEEGETQTFSPFQTSRLSLLRHPSFSDEY